MTAKTPYMESKIAHLDGEVLVIKNTLATFGTELHGLKTSVAIGFREQSDAMQKQGEALMAALDKQANAKPRVGLDNIMTMLTMGAMFCAVFWLIITQRIDPLKSDIEEGFSRADKESASRDSNQQNQLASEAAILTKIQEQLIEHEQKASHPVIEAIIHEREKAHIQKHQALSELYDQKLENLELKIKLATP